MAEQRFFASDTISFDGYCTTSSARTPKKVTTLQNEVWGVELCCRHMKAVQINRYGGSEVLEINENSPKPSAGKNQVLVDVHAASINPFDFKVRAGYMKDMMPVPFPVTLGGDFAGVVSEVSEGVLDYKPGDEVFGSALIFNGGSGSFAEQATANTKNVAHKPTSVNFEQAAALPLVGSSAVQALEDHIKLQSKQKILIHGGAGGIGHIAIQIAKALGAYVATTVGTDDIAFAKQLGADEVINYKTQKFEDVLKDFDAVFDTVGNSTWEKSFEVLKNGGMIVSMLGQPDPQIAQKKGITSIGQGTETNSDHLTRLAAYIDQRKVKVNVDKVFSMDQIKEAFEYQEKVHPRGKVVLKIAD